MPKNLSNRAIFDCVGDCRNKICFVVWQTFQETILHNICNIEVTFGNVWDTKNDDRSIYESLDTWKKTEEENGFYDGRFCVGSGEQLMRYFALGQHREIAKNNTYSNYCVV